MGVWVWVWVCVYGWWVVDDVRDGRTNERMNERKRHNYDTFLPSTPYQSFNQIGETHPPFRKQI